MNEPVSNHVLHLLFLNLAERAERVACVGESVYARPVADDRRVLKISANPGIDEVRITLLLIHPEHGPVDAATFIHTRAEKSSHVLEQMDEFLAIWF